MRVYTKVLYDWNGNILESESYEYSGPLALCVRELVNQGENASKADTSAGANLNAQGQGIQSSLVPQLQRQATNPQGYGDFGIAAMETGAAQTGAAASGAAAERMRLNAIRGGNRAGLNAGETAAAGEGARASGSALQSILAKQAQMKANQIAQAQSSLAGISGEDIEAGEKYESLVPEDIGAAADANQTGWVQNVNASVQAAAALIKAIKGV